MGVFLFVPQTSYADVLDVASFVANTLYGSIGKALYELLQTPLSWILSLAGQILDFTITLSLSATDLFNSPAVSIGWKAVRDIFNMFFIFSLIYISIKTILKSGGYKTSDALKNVIIGAVLINFSLYFTKIVIDISNVFAVWIYNGIQGLTPGGGGGISKTIQDIFSFEKMFQTKEVNDLSAFAAIFALIFLYAASIKIFLEVSFLFITRTVMFVFLLIMSPIGFVGEVFPKLASESKRWKEDLIGQALVAPVFLLLLYITLLFVDNIQQTTLFVNSKPTMDSTTKSSFTFVDFALFMITYFMIKKSLDVAKDFSGKSGDMITGAIKGGLGIALGAVSGGAALVGRRVIGGAAASLAQNAALSNAAAGKSGIVNQLAGKAILGAARGTASSNFDIRSTGILKGLSAETKALGVDISKTQKGGFKQAVKDRGEKEKKYAEEFGDDKDGISRRIAYAESRKGSILARLAIGNKNTEKMAGKLRNEAGLAFTKAESEDAQKDAQKIKNLIVDAQIVNEVLKKTTSAATTEDVNGFINQASSGLDNFLENRKKDMRNDKIKLMAKANHLDREIDEHIAKGNYERADEIRGDSDYAIFSNIRRGATKAEIEDAANIGEFTKEDFDATLKRYKTRVIKMQEQVADAQQILSQAKQLDTLIGKKTRVNDAIKKITDDIIGKEKKWNKQGEETQAGSGLNAELSESKRKATRAKGESRTLGAEGGGGRPPKEEDEDEEENPADKKT